MMHYLRQTNSEVIAVNFTEYATTYWPWNRAFLRLNDGTHLVTIVGTRATPAQDDIGKSEGRSSMAIDDVTIWQCAKYGKLYYWPLISCSYFLKELMQDSS